MMFSGWCRGQQNKGKRRFFHWENAKLIEPENTQQITLWVKKSVLEALKETGNGLTSIVPAFCVTTISGFTNTDRISVGSNLW